MKGLPQTPSQLTDALARIFPALPREFGEDGESVFHAAGPTYPSVLRDFAYFFQRNADAFSPRQMGRFADLLVACMAAPGALADAVQAFLDHTRQLKLHDRIEPHLAAAKKRAGQ
jgi:tryptophan synthase beta subunit